MDKRGVSVALASVVNTVKRTVRLELRRLPVEDGHEDGGLAHDGVLDAAGRGAGGLQQELRVALHRLDWEGEGKRSRAGVPREK